MPLNVDYQAVIADLEQRKSDLEHGISALKRIMARFDCIPTEKPEINITLETLRFLSGRPDESFYAPEIAAAISCPKVGSVRSAICRLFSRGRVQSFQNRKFRFLNSATEENRDA